MRETEGLLPLWYLDDGLSLFAGPLGRNEPHSHSVTVLLAGLYERFALRIDGGNWQFCRTAAIPAGVPYEFDMQGAPLAVLYAEPGRTRLDHLGQLLLGAWETSGALLSDSGNIALLREIYEDRDGLSWASQGLDDLLGFAEAKSGAVDPRVQRVLGALRENYTDLPRAGTAAAAAGLSPSRFQHVFTREVGVPFRRYRAWCRMRAAIGAVLRGSNLTTAAHAAGFADQAHFARDFRRIFGAPATPSLARVRRNAPG